VYIRYVRRVRVAEGRTFYLIPVANLGRPPLSAATANRCYRLEVAALQAALPSVARAKRANWRSATGTIIKTVNERPFHP
jgi:hypothetical protein